MCVKDYCKVIRSNEVLSKITITILMIKIKESQSIMGQRATQKKKKKKGYNGQGKLVEVLNRASCECVSKIIVRWPEIGKFRARF